MNDLTPFDPETAELESLFKRLHLANARRNWSALCERAEAERWSYRKLVAVLAIEEIGQRAGTRITRETRHAGFPFLKTVDDYDFSMQSTVKRALLGSYLGPELISEGRCLILYGKTGRGKTHLAVAIAYRAIQNGFTARFVTAAQLIDELSSASSKSNFRHALTGYTQPQVLVVDEVGYLNYGQDAANVLFHVVNDRHTRKRPMIFTTNKSPIAEWGQVLHDPDMADAIVDRILERGRLVVMDGPSYRTRHLDHPTGGRSDQAVRISGTNRSEFPEPASASGPCSTGT